MLILDPWWGAKGIAESRGLNGIIRTFLFHLLVLLSCVDSLQGATKIAMGLRKREKTVLFLDIPAQV